MLKKLLLALFISQAVWAQAPDQVTSEQAEIQELKRRLAELEARVNARASAPAASASPGTVAQDNLVSTPASAIPASVSADTSGFKIKSNDGNFSLKIGADLQTDLRTFTGAGTAGTTDQILLRRVRPTFSGTVYNNVDFFFRPDFGQGTTIIYDAYVQFNYFPSATLRVGKFKPPVGLERLQSDDDTSFIERGLPTLLAPSRDIGFQLGGDLP